MRATPLLFALALTSCSVSEVAVEFPEPVTEAPVWEHYRIADRDDSVPCSGASNESATLGPVFLAQTHVMEPSWPFFQLVADRPALVEVVVTGEGPSPEVAVDVFHDGEFTETLCLAGPERLPTDVDTTAHRKSDRFHVSLPAAWVRKGLSLKISAGEEETEFSKEALGVKYAPELSLVMIPMDILNYNDGREDKLPPDNFLEELTAALPITEGHFTTFPARISMPSIVVSGPDDGEENRPILLKQKLCGYEETPETHPCEVHETIDDGFVNAAALRMVEAFQRANGDDSTRIYYGNTEHLFPGGWGGGRTFVSADYAGVTIHEMGHALSLPHWGDTFEQEDVTEWSYVYPWGGENFNGGGRGPVWSYAQHLDTFINPTCMDPDSSNVGLQRSDGMQRNVQCDEWRPDGRGPWDGFSDFSNHAIFRFLTGAETVASGTVNDPLWGEVPYQLYRQDGYAVASWDEDGNQTFRWEHETLEEPSHRKRPFSWPSAFEVPVYTIYGTYMRDNPEATVLYEPVAHVGNLPELVDPTDPEIFDELVAGDAGKYEGHFYYEKDLTLKVTYADGSVQHAIYPHHTPGRDVETGSGPWRGDIAYFALNVPADERIKTVQLFERPFLVRQPDDALVGNILFPFHQTSPEEFMDAAVEIARYDFTQ